MKAQVLLFTLLIGFTLCEVMFLEKSNPVAPVDFEGSQNIADFYEGLFNHFNLSKPTQIIGCFNEINTVLYFKSLYETNELLEDVNARHAAQVHLDWGKVILINKALESTDGCIAQTQDFTDLLNALNIEERDPRLFAIVGFLYYQAHYPQLLDNYQAIISNLNNKNFTNAGDALGSALDEQADAIHNEGTAHLAYAGFSNGIAIGLDLPIPNDSLACFNNDTAHIYLEFLYQLAKAVTDGNPLDAPLNTQNFWNNTGEALINQIPDSTWQCLEQSNDNQQLSQKIGVQVVYPAFCDLITEYVKKHRLSWYGYMKGLKKTMGDHNFIHVGSIYGNLLKSIASKA